MPADANGALEPGVPSVEISSVGADYLEHSPNPCSWFVVDLQVPFNSSGGPAFTSAFSIEATAAEALAVNDCGYHWEQTYVYRNNSHETGFKYLGRVARYGVVSLSGTCQLAEYSKWHDPYPASFAPPSPVARSATYRIVTKGFLSVYWNKRYAWNPWRFVPMLVRATHAPALG